VFFLCNRQSFGTVKKEVSVLLFYEKIQSDDYVFCVKILTSLPALHNFANRLYFEEQNHIYCDACTVGIDESLDNG
jgi:hypothetical protein